MTEKPKQVKVIITIQPGEPKLEAHLYEPWIKARGASK